MKHIKKFESPNYIKLENDKEINWNDSMNNITFSYYLGKLVSCSNGDNHYDLYNAMFRGNTDYFEPVEGNIFKYKEGVSQEIKDKINTYGNSNGRGEYSGRVFVDDKILTFWKYPENNEKLKEIVKDLEEQCNLDMWNDDWKIEIILENENFRNRDYYYTADQELIPIKEYKKSKDRSSEELGRKHMEVGKGGAKPGFGSMSPKNKREWRNALGESILNESPDHVRITKENVPDDFYFLDYDDSDAMGFGINKDTGEFEIDNVMTHYDLPSGGRRYMKFPGRLWTDSKVISFWEYPKDKDELDNFIEQLNNEKNLIDDTWRIEIVVNKQGEPSLPKSKYWGYSEANPSYTAANIGEYMVTKSKLIPITDYVGSLKRSKEELEKAHLLSPLEKEKLRRQGKLKVEPGFGSTSPKNKREWRQALGESLITKFKMFENPNLVSYTNDEIKSGKPGKHTGVYMPWSEGVGFAYYLDSFIYGIGKAHEDILKKFLIDNNFVDLDEFDYDSYESEDLGNFTDLINLNDEEEEIIINYIKKYGRGELSGRLFPDLKLVTFWDFPKNNNEMLEIANDIKNNIGYYDIMDWSVECLNTTDTVWTVLNKYNRDNIFFIKVKDYKSSAERSTSEMAMKHIKVGKGGADVISGYGSRNKKNAREWRQALGENIDYQYYNKQLNPKFWSDNLFSERIREKLLTIANEFYNEMEYKVNIQDIVLTGSLANFNWNKFSDLDVHVIIDFKEIDKNVELVKKAVDGQRFIWNLRHNVSIKGHDVELYIQDITEPHNASGIFSLKDNKWINTPQYAQPQIDEELVNFKFLTYKSGIDKLEEISFRDMSPESAAKNHLYASEFKNKIMKSRKAGLETPEAEFSVENLVFKKLRNAGSIEKLIDTIGRFYDKIYSQVQ